MRGRGRYAMLVLSAAVLSGAWLLAEMMAQTEGAEEVAAAADTESVELSVGGRQELTALSWSYMGETVNLRRDGDRWVNGDDEACPIDGEKAEELARAAASVPAEAAIAGVAELEPYGLDEPAVTVVAATAESMARYDVGDMTPDGAYYVRLNGENTVYAVRGGLGTAFRVGLSEVLDLDGLPEDMARVTGLAVTSEAESYELRYLERDEPGWYRIDGDGDEPLDEERVRALYGPVAEMDLSRCVTWDPAEAAELGFDEPQARVGVTYADRTGVGGTFELVFGDYGEEGVYVRFAGSDLIFLTPASVLDGLMYPRWEAMRPASVLNLRTEAIASVRVRMEGRNYEIVRLEEKTERTVGDGTEPVTDVIYSCNGWVLDTGEVERWLGALSELKAADAEPAGEGRQTLLRATITWKDEESEPAELELRSYDSVHSLCVLGADRFALVSRSEAEALLDGAESMLARS